MSASIPSAELPPHAAVAALGRLVLNFRLVTILLSVLYGLPDGVALPGLTAALLAALAVSFVPLLRWDRVAPVLMRHPVFLAVDLVLSVGILLFTGTEGPFLSYTLGTAFLAGVLYAWPGAVFFAALLTGGYVLVLTLRAPIDDLATLGFEAVVGVPSRYVLFALGATAVRGLLVRQAHAESALAAVQERARLAREMHDTLTKTLHGIALSAQALPRWIDRDPHRAERDAVTVARAVETAALQARELIGALRADRLDEPLHEAVGRCVHEWSAATGIPAAVDVEPVGGEVGPGARYELFRILSEALSNVDRHARASSVRVALRRCAGSVLLTVADDGVGLPPGSDLDALAAAGHFGLVGMAERATRAGGTLELSRNGQGLDITVAVPVAV